jgi:hypothetical protein
MLKPLIERSPDCKFAIGRDEASQRDWARCQGLSERTSLANILAAQIEDHRADVFFNHDPVRFDSSFVKRLPGCVRRSVAWRAAPSRDADLGAYSLVVCNFESILRSWRDKGCRTAWFAPAHDPEMAPYAANEDRDLDVVFVGTYSRHHRNRAAIIERIANLPPAYRVRICLLQSGPTKVASLLPSWMPFTGRYALPTAIRRRAASPAFGRELYELISRAKVVINGAIDMAGADRGNMRCFEALGLRTLLLSDEGIYPAGMEAGRTIETYESADEMDSKIHSLLADPERRCRIANAGYEMICTSYSKEEQWRQFLQLVG